MIAFGLYSHFVASSMLIVESYLGNKRGNWRISYHLMTIKANKGRSIQSGSGKKKKKIISTKQG